MIWTINTHARLMNLLIAFKLGDLNKYLIELERCKKFLDDDLYAFFFNLSKATIFTRKGYYKL